MKTQTFFLFLFLFILSLASFHAKGQDCMLVKGKCQGTCGTWYFRSNLNPSVAGNPTCDKVKVREEKGKPVFECHCFLLHSATTCLDVEGECDGFCPPVYPTIADAMAGTNPISGECISIRTGNNPNCTCKYEKGPE